MSFKQYCEYQDKTIHYAQTPDSGYRDSKNKSFEQGVDPLIKEFSKKILTNVLNEYVPNLNEIQINYILDKVRTELENTHYTPINDLSKTISNIWKSKQTISTNKPIDTKI